MRKIISILMSAIVFASVLALPIGVMASPQADIIKLDASNIVTYDEFSKAFSYEADKLSDASVILVPVAPGDKTELYSPYGDNYLSVASNEKSIPIEDNGKSISDISIDKNGNLIIPKDTNELNNKTAISMSNYLYDVDIQAMPISKEDPTQIKITKSVKYKDFVNGLGTDLYRLETPPQLYDKSGHVKYIVSVELLIDGDTTGLIKVNGVEYPGSRFTANPNTLLPWTWEDISNLQAGIQNGTCQEFRVRVNFKVGSQSFFAIDPTNAGIGGEAWGGTINLTGIVADGATGAIIHIYLAPGAGAKAVGWRKYGSTDARIQTMERFNLGTWGSSHLWTIVGLDANKTFEFYNGDSAYIPYIVGYTMSGVTMLTNATDNSTATTGSWVDISADAPSATGLIFEVIDTLSTNPAYDFRKNGSTDVRIGLSGIVGTLYQHSAAMVGCDASQIAEQYISSISCDVFLTGYVTDGATFYTNSPDLTTTVNNTWNGLPPFPANTGFAFVNVMGSGTTSYWGLRPSGSTTGQTDNTTGMSTGDCHSFGIVVTNNSTWALEGFSAITTNNMSAMGYSEVTSATTPTVDVVDSSNITGTTADLQMHLQSSGTDPTTDIGVAWSTATQGDPGAAVPPSTYTSNKTTSAPTIAVDKYTFSITGLSSNTSYYCRAYADNVNGYNWSDNQTIFATDSVPTVTTNASDNISFQTEQLNGTIDSIGGDTVTERGFGYGTTSIPNAGVVEYPFSINTSGSYGVGIYNINATGLTANTTYYSRAYAINSIGRMFGAEVSWTTDPTDLTPPTVTTGTVNMTSYTTAQLNGTITATDTTNVTTIGFQWGTASGVYTSTYNTTAIYPLGDFSYSGATFAQNTTYYVQSYVSNYIAVGLGAEVNFTTLAYAGVSISTQNATNVGDVTAELNGTIISTGGDNAVMRGFEYGTAAGVYTNATNTTGSYGAGAYSIVGSFSDNTTYFARAYAMNSINTTYGEEITFTTLETVITPVIVFGAIAWLAWLLPLILLGIIITLILTLDLNIGAVVWAVLIITTGIIFVKVLADIISTF